MLHLTDFLCRQRISSPKKCKKNAAQQVNGDIFTRLVVPDYLIITGTHHIKN